MNEHIKQLARQANIPEYNLQYGTELCIAPHLSKFAELIIQECASQCDPEPGLKYSPNAKSSREDCKEKILRLIG